MYSTAESSTPRPTATWIGRIRVEIKVTSAAMRDPQPVLHTDEISEGLRLRKPARIRRVPSAGMAM